MTTPDTPEPSAYDSKSPNDCHEHQSVTPCLACFEAAVPAPEPTCTTCGKGEGGQAHDVDCWRLPDCLAEGWHEHHVYRGPVEATCGHPESEHKHRGWLPALDCDGCRREGQKSIHIFTEEP